MNSTTATIKRKRSNEQRLRAVEEKRARLKSQHLSIQVKNGVSSSGRNQHVVFSSESEDSSQENDGQKIELFGDGSSESGSEVNLGEKFVGDNGAKLFQLQRKVGHDARFRVDKRFLEDGEDMASGDEDGRRNKDYEDNISKQMEREKANALQIINSMFNSDYPCSGQLSSHGGHRQTTANHSRGVLPPRYDPISDTHAQLEITHGPPSVSSPQRSSAAGREGMETPSAESPLQRSQVASTDRYYSVSENMNELFNSSNDKFSFFTESNGDLDNDSVVGDDLLPMATTAGSTSNDKVPKWIRTFNRVSSSPEAVESAKVMPDSESAVATAATRLFFHSSTPTLRNRLGENSFYRSEPLHELELSWPQRRTAMKDSFRKRRKEAMKMSKKRRKYHF